jgi:hypothetical protein
MSKEDQLAVMLAQFVAAQQRRARKMAEMRIWRAEQDRLRDSGRALSVDGRRFFATTRVSSADATPLDPALIASY